MLANLLRRWKQLKRELEEVETRITNEVLTLRKSIRVGDVEVKYSRDRGSFDYRSLAHHLGADEALLAQHTKTVVDWRGVVEDMGDISEETKERFYIPAEHPVVTIRLKQGQAE